MALPPPPELIEDLVEEILLRFPPDDPASLVRAGLVCKLWCRLVCGAAFRRRFHEFHRRAAPLLGLIYDEACYVRGYNQLPVAITYFVPTASLRPAHAAAGRYGCCAMDARHGRVLLYRHREEDDGQPGDLCDLCVWDPVTDEQQDLPKPPFHAQIAAVACAVTATGGDCGDHLDCSHGPFLVFVMRMLFGDFHLAVYSSEAGYWSKVTICEGPATDSSILMFSNVPSVLVRSALYILIHYLGDGSTMNHVIVKYDWATRQMSMIQLPSEFPPWERSIVLVTDDDGGLGIIANVEGKLQLWSRVAGGFVPTRVIDLREVLPADALINKKPQVDDFYAFVKKDVAQVTGFADGGATRILFIRTFDALYSIDMNSNQVKKLANCCGKDDVLPYISFCTPTSRVQH